MERKIGEIFEYNGEWYQCVKDDMYDYCKGCASFENLRCTTLYGNRDCWLKATCKKLEKVGQPYLCNYYVDKEALLMQPYRYYGKDTDVKCPNAIHAYIINRRDKIVAIEIKQNQEDMEENKLNLKPFDIQKAREGKPVCTRDGRKARIICFDAKGDKPIIALVEAKGNKDALIEKVERYFINGHSVFEVRETNNDLMILPEKHEGWLNIYKTGNDKFEALVGSVYLYKTEKEAKIEADPRILATVKVEWEE